ARWGRRFRLPTGIPPTPQGLAGGNACPTISWRTIRLRPASADGTLAGAHAYYLRDLMTATTSPLLGPIHALLAEKGYEVSEPAPDTLTIREVESGVTARAVLQGDILFLSLVCTVVPKAAVTPAIMASMLDAGNGISTSYFQLYDAGDGKLDVTLNNFC